MYKVVSLFISECLMWDTIFVPNSSMMLPVNALVLALVVFRIFMYAFERTCILVWQLNLVYVFY